MGRSVVALETHDAAKSGGSTATDERQRVGAEPSCPICGASPTFRWLEGPDRFHNRSHVYELQACSACSIVWLLDAPPPDAMGEHYGPAYHRMITRAGEGSAARWTAHHDVVERFKGSGAILDIGCSSGSFLETLKGDAWKLSGIEISAPEAERARKRTQADVFAGDILDAPFSPECFDAITSFDVLEHLHRPREAMSKVFEWLKPNGIFYVGIPNVRSWEARLFQSYWYGLELPRHLYHFSPKSLRHLMASIGFTEEWVQTPPLTYIEYSTRYACDGVLRKLGVSRKPLALVATRPSLPWRVVRKAWRLTGLSLWSHAASYASAGPAIEAVFRKAR